MRCVFDDAGIFGRMRNKLWCEAFVMAVDWWNVSLKQGEDKCSEMKWSNELPKWIGDLRRFGEAGIVKKGGILKKLEQRGFDGVKVGNVDGHAKGVHRMHNLTTGLVNIVRDMRWLNKMCHECRRDAGKEETEEGSESSSGLGQEEKRCRKRKRKKGEGGTN